MEIVKGFRFLIRYRTFGTCSEKRSRRRKIARKSLKENNPNHGQIRAHKRPLLLRYGVLETVTVVAPFFTQENFPVEKPLIEDYPEKGVYAITRECPGSISNNIEGIADKFTAVNPLDETISLPIGSKTCHCVATDFSDVDLRPHESVPVKPTFTPVNGFIRCLDTGRQTRSRENIHKIIDRDLKDV